MPHFILRVFDFLLCAAAAALFGACLTAKLQTGAYGLSIPDAPYIYGHRDFIGDAVLAGVAGLLILILSDRLIGRTMGRGMAPKRAVVARAVMAFIAAMIAMYLGPPSPLVFGNTWTSGEVLRELFLAQWDIALPLAVAAVVARMGYRRLLLRPRGMA